MTSFMRRLAKPEYLFRPRQIVRRLLRPRSRSPESALVTLPWGLAMQVAPRETIGGGIWRVGVHELVVSEVLWRLIDRGEWTLDVGANSGYFAGLMAVRTGPQGSVWAFEPHPEMRRRLEANAAAWRACGGGAAVRVWDCALSDREGTAHLRLPALFEINTGTASIGSPGEGPAIAVPARRLDALLPPDVNPSVAKVDVEGHEAHVLRGARELLARGGLRDIVFEEHRPYPAESTSELEAHGFAIFRLGRSLLRPVLIDPRTPMPAESWEAPNFLATRDPARARARVRRAGWQCLSRARAA